MVSRTGSRRDSGGGKGRFKYQARSAEDVHKRATQSGGRFDSPFVSGVDVFRPPNGESYIRILPPTWDDADHYGLEAYMHRFVGGDNSNYLCHNKMLGKPCAACDEMKATKAAGEDDEAKALAPQKRVIVYVLDRDDKTATPMPWDMSWSQDRDIAALCENKRTGKVLLIDHPDDGYDIIVKKTGAGLKTRYQFVIDREPSSISDDQKEQDAILAYIEENPLPELLRYDTNEHIAKQLEGGTPSRDEDLDKDDDDRGGRGRGRGRDKDDDKEERGSRRARGRDKDDDKDDKDERGSRGRGRGRDDNDEIEEERPRSRRDRDADEDKGEDDDRSSSRRGRGREDDDKDGDKDDRGSSRRGRGGDDDDKEERGGRRGRGRDAEEDKEAEERPRRERLTRDKDDDKDDDRSSRGRGRDRDDDKDDKDDDRGSRSRGRDRDDDAEERGSRRRR